MTNIVQYDGDEAGRVLAEIVQVALEKPDGTMAEMQTALTILHKRAEVEGDEAGARVIANVWQGALEVYQANEYAISVAEAARQVAVTMNQQREMAIQQHEELTRAVKRGDRNNVLVEDLLSSVELDMYSEAYTEAYENVMDEISFEARVIENAWETLVNEAGIPLESDWRADDANTFIDAITGHTQISSEVAQMIADAIHGICRAIDAENGINNDDAA